MRSPISTLLLLACIPATAAADAAKKTTKAPAVLEVTSTSFTDQNPIPAEHTCDGDDQPPPLSWSKVPVNTKSIAILVDDPDAPNGTFTHWLVTGLPATTTSLSGTLPPGAVAAANDKGTPGYAGPCPPTGSHRYQFQVFALDTTLPAVLTKADFSKKIKGHVLATGQLVGMYRRRNAG